MLAEDLTAPRKQKHTARRVFARLADEHGATELSYHGAQRGPLAAAWRLMLTLDGGQELFVAQEHCAAPIRPGGDSPAPARALQHCSEVHEMVAVLHRLANSGPRSPA
jgi:hypothetical protein